MPIPLKTARFAAVVDKCGRPEVYLTLLPLAKDPALQAAIKASRIMTVAQFDVGNHADFGQIGYEPSVGRQLLVFPKSLKHFAGKKIVGIKYELLAGDEAPKPSRVDKKPKTKPAILPRPPKPPKPQRPVKVPKVKAVKKTELKVVPKPLPEPKPTHRSPEPKRAEPAKAHSVRVAKKRNPLKVKIEEVLELWDHGHELRANKLLKEIARSLE